MTLGIERSEDYQKALKAILTAQVAEDPLDKLLDARESLVKLIDATRSAYLSQANEWLVKAGAVADVELREFMSETEILTGEADEDEGDYEDKKQPAGFQRNVTGD